MRKILAIAGVLLSSAVVAQTNLTSTFSSYTVDGLFHANAAPSGVTTPSGQMRIRFGYYDQGGGQYWGRIGFLGNSNWSAGTFSGGYDFSIGKDVIGSQFLIKDNGNIGIGTTTPLGKQHITINAVSSYPTVGIAPALVLEHNGFDGQLQFLTSSNYASFLMFGDERDYSRGSVFYDHRSASERFGVNVNATERFSIVANGNVGIGTTSPAERLSVNGNITANGVVYARKLIVKPNPWADYVFYESYPLRTISTLERFIKQNKHLPDVPSAKEVNEQGIDLGNNQAVLLKKIEELTLYIIDQEKRIAAMEKRLNKKSRS